MTSQQILQSDFLDILFDGRNKAYGAYLLRRRYPQQLGKAMGITASLVLLLLVVGGGSPTQTRAVPAKDDLSLSVVHLPPELPKQLPKPKLPAPTQPRVRQEILLDKLKIVADPVTPIATQQSLDDALPGSEKVEGPPITGPVAPKPPAISSGGTGQEDAERKETPLPSRQPQFPGGAAAWLKFLERHLTPPNELEPGERRSVMVRFSVDEEGVVTNFVVVQSGGAAFDNEVIRVLKKMPRWLPAVQAGKPVAVSFTQPVTFQGPE